MALRHVMALLKKEMKYLDQMVEEGSEGTSYGGNGYNAFEARLMFAPLYDRLKKEAKRS